MGILFFPPSRCHRKSPPGWTGTPYAMKKRERQDRGHRRATTWKSVMMSGIKGPRDIREKGNHEKHEKHTIATRNRLLAVKLWRASWMSLSFLFVPR